jgi:hypothetical protein
MADSLRTKLAHALETKYPNYLTLDEIDEICSDPERKYKNTNAERRFRFDKKCPHLYIPNERVWNEKHTAIIGYKWTQTEQPKPLIILKENNQPQLFRPGYNY